jgi:hypothetical protein
MTEHPIIMLSPRELLLAQGFPASYQIDHIDGKRVPKSAQTAMIGNSVCPPLARALVAANYVATPAEDTANHYARLPLFRQTAKAAQGGML